MEKNLGLGKGLSALMGDDFNQSVAVQPSPDTAVGGIVLAQITSLIPSPFQPRRVFAPEALSDLIHSIREKGVLQPLLVRRHPTHEGMYEIIAGERRFRASKEAGLSQVPVIIKDFDDKAALEVALIENLQREDLNPLEEGEAYRRLLNEFQYTQEELSQVVGKSRSHVANMMRLLELPDDIKQMVENKELTIGHARALLNAENPSVLAAEIVREKLFLYLRQELPYALTVEPDLWERREDGSVRAEITIYVERDSQKIIVLGKGGAMIKRIGQAARRELEDLLEDRIHLFLFVKVRENWGDDPARYVEWGLNFNS